ncbi:SpoIIE family protein phosphatase [bacterium]|nr:SpoIIE family protein phosphatase [bacterium]
MITERLNHLLKAAVALISLALLGILCVFFIREATKVSKWGVSGEISNTRMELTEDSVYVFERVTESDFTSPPYPVVGDTVVMLNDTAVTIEYVNAFQNTVFVAGYFLPVAYLREGVETTSEIELRYPAKSEYYSVILLQWLRFLIGFGYMGVGLWAFFKRPDSAAVRVFALFCGSMTSFMIAGVNVLEDKFALFDIPFWEVFRQILGGFGLLMAGFWLNLNLLFPHTNRFMQHHPAWAYVACYFFAVAAIISNISYVGLNEKAVDIVVGAGMIGSIAAGFVLLVHNFIRAENRVERRQTQLVLWGTGLGLITFFLLVGIAAFFREWFAERALLLINITFLLLLLSPLSFAYAFGKFGLLEVQGRIRRGTRFVLVGLTLGVVYGAGAVLIGNFVITQLNIESNIPTIVVALVFAMGISPTQKKLRAVLERRFYPERIRLRQMMEGLLEEHDYVGNRTLFWSELESRIRSSLSVESVFPVLAGINGAQFMMAERDATPFCRESSFVLRLAKERRPLLVDEMIASERVELSVDENEWLHSRRIALVMPLVTNQRLVGFLGMGFKLEDEDYAPEELRILNSYAPQLAMASENIRLVEENVEKRRLEEQMAIARRIQQGLLPQSLPETPGLEVAAGSRFSLEVAGDYYDVMTPNETQTVFAVGDVSGKGAGAALLMANLQASMRTAIGLGVRLSDTVARVSDLIYHNTPPEQYITFVVGLYDAANGELRYVNAGHNPPVVVRANGESELLDIGGLILGCLPGSQYEEGVVQLSPGDLVMMFTDGISEAMNDANEEYGEERIREFVVRNRTLPCTEILSALEEDVIAFCGREPNEDDSTFLIARRKYEL